MKIPRPAGAKSSPGVGKIFIKFEAPEAATEAIKSLAGRRFADRTVVVTHFSEVSLHAIQYMLSATNDKI